jgi:BirA family biotin operon repressor/biotin-[acetyl-CoA-carboxylase] ligase
LYFSIVLRPKIETKFLPLITLMAGVAVHASLQELDLKPDIKWVNDILVNQKKISGILAETSETDDGLAVIVGIGVNLKTSNFPPEIAGIATAIESEPGAIATGDLTEILTKYISYFYDILTTENGPTKIVDEWRRRPHFSGRLFGLNSGTKRSSASPRPSRTELCVFN